MVPQVSHGLRVGARLVDVDASGGDENAPVAALAEFGAGAARLGLGQWLKLALWELDDYDAVSRASTPTSLSRMKLSPRARSPATRSPPLLAPLRA